MNEHRPRSAVRNWVTKNRVNWADIDARLDAILSDLDDTQRDLIRIRWLQAAQRKERLWRSHRSHYYWMRIPIIIGAATVPVLVSFNIADWNTATVGLHVAILTGLDSFLRYGLRWQQLRHASAEIESEGWRFLVLTGPYAEFPDHKTAYTPFLGNIDTIERRHATDYLDLFRAGEPARRPNGHNTGREGSDD